MMKSFFGLCFLSFFFVNIGFGADSFGRFVGTLKHDRLQREQLAKIDFVAHRQTGSSLELMAVLTLQFGEFTSGEYISYHFDSVRYNISTSTLVFDQADQDVSLVVERFDGNNLTANLRHVSGGNVGKISLVRDGIAHPTLPLIQPLWGEYRGSCESPYGEADRMVMRLKTSRSSADSSRVGNPFGSYDIRGSIGSIDLCNSVESAAGGICQITPFRTGSYNFLRGDLRLMTNTSPFNCVVEADGLKCQPNNLLGKECRFTRTSREATASQKDYSPPIAVVSEPSGIAPDSAITSVGGEYRGYLHHEYLNEYQAASLNLLVVPPAAGGGSFQMSAVSSLFFGDFESLEQLSYRFDRKEYPLLAQSFVFSRAEADVDAILKVTSIGGGVVKGVWYSLLFGRVGTFVLTKDRLPALPNGAKLMEPLAAQYEDCCFGYDESPLDLNIQVVQDRTPINSENPFFPLNITGYYQYRTFTPIIAISGGTYDFYTGRISFGDGKFVGQRRSRRDMYLSKPLGGAFFSEQEPHHLKRFRLIGN